MLLQSTTETVLKIAKNNPAKTFFLVGFVGILLSFTACYFSGGAASNLCNTFWQGHAVSGALGPALPAIATIIYAFLGISTIVIDRRLCKNKDDGIQPLSVETITQGQMIERLERLQATGATMICGLHSTQVSSDIPMED